MILIPVCLAYQLFLLEQTAFRKGNKAPIPNALATTANALDVAFLTNSSLWSISGLITVIIVGSRDSRRPAKTPAAFFGAGRRAGRLKRGGEAAGAERKFVSKLL